MQLKDLFNDPDFLMSTNIEIILMKLAVDLGKKREDIEAGKYDDVLGDAKGKIYDQINKHAMPEGVEYNHDKGYYSKS